MTDPTPSPPAANLPPAAGPAEGELPGAAPDRAARIEALRWKKFDVLDDGFVTLVDVMGDDAAVVQAARVSYGEGTKSVSDNRGLIRYLMRHAHSTPFEMAELKFLFRVPMDTWRQQIRHRTACLAGGTELYFDLPGAEARGRRQLSKVRLDDLHRRWTGGTVSRFDPKRKPTHLDRVDAAAEYSVPELAKLVERREECLRNMIRGGYLAGRKEGGRLVIRGRDWHAWAARGNTLRVPHRDRIRGMRLRMCDEATGDIRHTHITDVWESGVKPVFRVTLENGRRLEMTADHRCLTDAGWRTLSEATGLKRGAGRDCTWRADAPAFAVNGVPAHRDRAWLAERRAAGRSVTQIAEAAGVSYHTIRKALSRYGLQFTTAEKARQSGLTRRGRRRTARTRGPLTGEALANVRRARSGANSNFWRGGTATERASVGRWTTENAPRVHERCGYRCAICGSHAGLEAHHVAPVWHAPDRARNFNNLLSLCGACHRRLHATHRELDLLAEANAGADLAGFWERHGGAAPRPAAKRAPRVRRLRRAWSRVARIEYVGEKMTYDVAVDGPYHNFVADGFVVHNSVNEYSTRYSVAIDAAQTTEPAAWRTQAASNRQGSEGFLPADIGEAMTAAETELQAKARAVYDARLAAGVAREQARKDLPLSTYTEAYWKVDLHNLLHFLALRMDSHAQQEIRDYATTVGERIVAPLFPLTWEAFRDYRLNASVLTGPDRGVIRRLAATGAAPPYPDEAFLAAQDPAWADLKRCRERDECRAKLVSLGLMAGE